MGGGVTGLLVVPGRGGGVSYSVVVPLMPGPKLGVGNGDGVAKSEGVGVGAGVGTIWATTLLSGPKRARRSEHDCFDIMARTSGDDATPAIAAPGTIVVTMVVAANVVAAARCTIVRANRREIRVNTYRSSSQSKTRPAVPMMMFGSHAARYGSIELFLPSAAPADDMR